MANDEDLTRLRQGFAVWNAWRGYYHDSLDLCGADLRQMYLSKVDLSRANLTEVDLSRANLFEADLRGANLFEADLRGADLGRADLGQVNLNYSIFIETNLMDADLTGCRVYGISAWDLKVQGATQLDLVITRRDQPEITVDNLELAQFIYLLLNNDKIRDVIDTITSKTVLILGRFNDERKPVLDALREALREQDLLPILFDFSIPASRDVTETVKVLASLARFVIADVTDATEVRAELHNIVRDFPSLAVQPLLLRGQSEFVSLPGHLAKFPWVLSTFEYEDLSHLLANLKARVIEPVIKKHEELIGS